MEPLLFCFGENISKARISKNGGNATASLAFDNGKLATLIFKNLSYGWETFIETKEGLIKLESRVEERDPPRHYVDMGIGRYITKEEALEILEKAEQDGLVLQPENSQCPEAICCCCGDCCVLLKPLKSHPRPVDICVTNYYIEYDDGLCNGCGECIDKCQMDARVMADGIAELNPDRCVGCGSCVVSCPSDANRLVKKQDETVLPRDKNDFSMQTLSNRTGKWNTLKVRAKMLLGMKV